MTEPTDELETPPPVEGGVPTDPCAPSLESAMRRLRMDEDLQADAADAIPAAKAEAEAYLDGKLYATAQALQEAQDPKGILCTPDIIAAQLLLVDALVNDNTDEGADLKRTRAFNMLRRHRNQGA